MRNIATESQKVHHETYASSSASRRPAGLRLIFFKQTIDKKIFRKKLAKSRFIGIRPGDEVKHSPAKRDEISDFIKTVSPDASGLDR